MRPQRLLRDRVLLAHAFDLLVALDVSDPRRPPVELWRRRATHDPFGLVAAATGTDLAFLETVAPEPELVGLDPRSGDERVRLRGARLVAEGPGYFVVSTAASGGGYRGFDASGTERWSFDLYSSRHSVSATAGREVFVSDPDGGAVHVVDGVTGEEVRRLHTPRLLDTVVEDVAFARGGRFDPSTAVVVQSTRDGRPMWSWSPEDRNYLRGNLLAHLPGRLFVASGRALWCLVDADDRQIP